MNQVGRHWRRVRRWRDWLIFEIFVVFAIGWQRVSHHHTKATHINIANATNYTTSISGVIIAYCALKGLLLRVGYLLVHSMRQRLLVPLVGYLLVLGRSI